jgi:hypothetical protein
MATIQRFVNDLPEPRASLGAFAIPNRFDHQVAKWPVVEKELADHVEQLSAERDTLLFQLLQNSDENLALTRFLGNEVPQMADLVLTDAMNPTEALFETIRIPRQVVVDCEMRAGGLFLRRPHQWQPGSARPCLG